MVDIAVPKTFCSLDKNPVAAERSRAKPPGLGRALVWDWVWGLGMGSSMGFGMECNWGLSVRGIQILTSKNQKLGNT